MQALLTYSIINQVSGINCTVYYTRDTVRATNAQNNRIKLSCRFFERRYNATKCFNDQLVNMNRKSKSFATLLGSAAVAVLVFAQNPDQDGLLFCSCEEGIKFNHDLPMSHPTNRCASEQSAKVSWSSWFSGAASNSQFHYLDLLELLYSASDESEKAPHRP